MMNNEMPESFELIDCPVCNLNRFYKIATLTAEQFFSKEQWAGNLDLGVVGCNEQTPFHYQKCLSCGFVFTNPRLKVSFQDKLYNNLKTDKANELGWADQDMEWAFDGSDLAHLYNTFFKWSANEYLSVGLSFFASRFRNQKNINYKRITLLDYGSGMGHLLELSRTFGVDAKGIEIDAKRIEYCKSKGLNVFRPEDFPDEKFDIIISTSVLEHIYDLGDYFKFIYSHLSDEGIFIFNGLTPTVIYNELHTKKFRDASPLHHVNMFTSSSLKKIAQKYNLSPVSNKRILKAMLKKKPMGLHFLNYLYHKYVRFGGKSGLFLYILSK